MEKAQNFSMKRLGACIVDLYDGIMASESNGIEKSKLHFTVCNIEAVGTGGAKPQPSSSVYDDFLFRLASVTGIVGTQHISYQLVGCGLRDLLN